MPRTFVDARGIDVGVDDARRFAAVGEHFAPRIDDQRMAVGRAVARVLAAHRRREHEARVLDRARLESVCQCTLPVARWNEEGIVR